MITRRGSGPRPVLLEQVLDVITRRGGATSFEIAAETGMTRQGAVYRCRELAHRGEIVDSGRKKFAGRLSGPMLTVWVVKERGEP